MQNFRQKEEFARANTCLGAGPDGIFTILDVTSKIRLLTDKSEVEVPFSGQRCSLSPEQGDRLVTKTKWVFPFAP